MVPSACETAFSRLECAYNVGDYAVKLLQQGMSAISQL